jgi:hypothetical protein
LNASLHLHLSQLAGPSQIAPLDCLEAARHKHVADKTQSNFAVAGAKKIGDAKVKTSSDQVPKSSLRPSDSISKTECGRLRKC